MIVFLGIDIGSVSSNFVLIDQRGEVLFKLYERTEGDPIGAIQKGLRKIEEDSDQWEVMGVGTTGSARDLASILVGADIVKNEITAHATAAIIEVPKVSTVLEIGGQDSKIIFLRNGVMTDFAMNTVCAAGTGSFLDNLASRWKMSIEEFADLSREATQSVNIAGRCAVFAESDIVHHLQKGKSRPEIVRGAENTIARNFLNNLASNKKIEGPIVFQGGVAANQGVRRAFRELLGQEVFVPEHYSVMGALGAAHLAKEKIDDQSQKTKFRGFDISEMSFRMTSFHCKNKDCGNNCEITVYHQTKDNGKEIVIARTGGKCERHNL